MAKVTKCDRCGTILPKDEAPNRVKTKKNQYAGGATVQVEMSTYDLCDSCLESLQEFMDGISFIKVHTLSLQGGDKETETRGIGWKANPGAYTGTISFSEHFTTKSTGYDYIDNDNTRNY